jgi:hypothetical protein
MASLSAIFRIVRLIAAFAAAGGVMCAQTPLGVRADAGRIYPTAPKLRFIEGQPLDRLHNGSPVVFALQFTIFAPSRSIVHARSTGRFAVSYDLWEEKFVVTHLGSPRKSASHLSAPEAETWCLDSLSLPSDRLSPDSRFWVRLDVRAERPDESPPPGEQTGATLTRLIELFSRPQPSGETRALAEAGPFRPRDLH